MERIEINPRLDYKTIVEKQGLKFHTIDGEDYWNEKAYYSFGIAEINKIEKATEQCHQFYIEAAEHLVKHPQILKEQFVIPEDIIPFVIDSWNNESDDAAKVKCLNYGRFDFSYNGSDAPKLLEYNCDTPTSLLEASVIQHFWKQDVFPELDQFNSLHEKLIERYISLDKNGVINPYVGKIHFTGMPDHLGEDITTISYHMDLCEAAGIKASLINAKDIGLTPTGMFVDMSNKEIDTLFHLYPLEWMVNEKFGKALAKSRVNLLEPLWKMLWSNKAILPILWELFAGHESILPASFTPMAYDCIAKPVLAREGGNITILRNNEVSEQTGGLYGDVPLVYQKLHELPNFNGNYPVIGSWCVNGNAAGMGIREDKGLITGNGSAFVPHIIRG